MLFEVLFGYAKTIVGIGKDYLTRRGVFRESIEATALRRTSRTHTSKGVNNAPNVYNAFIFI